METTKPTRCITAVLCLVLALLAAPAAHAYGWPVKPFDHQHPIRAYLGDPRIGSGLRSLHFGIDISAPNGTPVYATISGSISRHPLHPTEVVLVSNGSVTFEYWHIVPVVSSGRAVAYRTLLGHIAAPWAHVHFAERHGSSFVNPLRPGALAPYRDTTRPTVGPLSIQRRAGAFDVSVEAYDEPPLAVPAPWNGKPVTPALVEWRLGRTGAWRVAADFRGVLPPSFDAVYAPGTTQNHVPSIGRYRFVLLRGWRATARSYVVQIRVSDESGHRSTRAEMVRVAS